MILSTDTRRKNIYRKQKQYIFVYNNIQYRMIYILSNNNWSYKPQSEKMRVNGGKGIS